MATLRQAVITGGMPAGGSLTATVNLAQPATAGSTLIVLMLGVIGTARITDASGATFTKRTTYGGGTFDVSVSDFVAVGGETAVHLTKNADFNMAYVVVESSPVTFASWSNNGAGSTTSIANDHSVAPTSPVTASAASLLVAGWVAEAAASTVPFNAFNSFRNMGPLGRIVAGGGVQPNVGGAPDLIYAAGLADVTASGRWPVTASAGDYMATTQWPRSVAGVCAAQALYTDASGMPTNPAPANPIVAENSLPGTHKDNWAAVLATDSTICGFTDKVSYSPGDTVAFKVHSPNAFRVEVFRLGHYGHEEWGARRVVANITGTPTTQSAPTVDGTLGSASCAWSTSASWTIPSDAAPGRYYVLFRRTDEAGHLAQAWFTVKGATTEDKVVVVAPDCTLAAYNLWGGLADNGDRATGTNTGRSLYQAGTDGAIRNFGNRAYAASLDRPNTVNVTDRNTGLFDSEYGVIHWLEAQGYDLTYLSDADLDVDPTLLLDAKVAVMNGHHEYVSENQWNAWRDARDAGVNIAIIGSNVALWRVRFAAGDTGRRTMICYKDSGTVDSSPGFTGTGRDPGGYTGTWRDSRTAVAPNNPDVRPDSALTGQWFGASAPVALQMTVPFASKSLPIWRNSSAIQALTSGQVYTTPQTVLGDEADLMFGDAFNPSNIVALCPTSVNYSNAANANGTLYSSSVSGTAGFSLYRADSGALVFHTGSWRGWWSCTRWRSSGLDGTSVDVNWQNAALAVMYDLGAVPTAPRAVQPGVDTTPTNPATGAPAGTRDNIAAAYGLDVPSGTGAFLLFE